MLAGGIDLATALKERFEDRTIRVPSGDPVLRADLHAVRKTVGPTGSPRLAADGETDGHADRFWAAALACAAAAESRPPPAGAWAQGDPRDAFTPSRLAGRQPLTMFGRPGEGMWR